LNRNQSLEMAFLIADRLTSGRIKRGDQAQQFQLEDF
jgi:3-deoxy-7-phosphoheptulonate synthase